MEQQEERRTDLCTGWQLRFSLRTGPQYDIHPICVGYDSWNGDFRWPLIVPRLMKEEHGNSMIAEISVWMSLESCGH